MNDLAHDFQSAESRHAASAIEELVDLMRRMSTPDSALTESFHATLDEIERLSQICATERPALLSYALEMTSSELLQSKIHAQGRLKPMGYAGDFQIIDWTYTRFSASPGRGRMWDEFYHLQNAPLAVCDRKHRFGRELSELSWKKNTRPLRVLNVASGPCRELLDGVGFADLSPREIEVHCVDSDDRSIQYAKDLLGESWSDTVMFHHQNAVRFRPPGEFDLIWCAGLFDYLEHRLAVIVAKRLWRAVAPGGRLVIGNFSSTHKTRPWIEWCGNWFLIHRTEADFSLVAEDAGIPAPFIHHNVDKWGAIRFLTAVRPE